jgi:hypothetical protein
VEDSEKRGKAGGIEKRKKDRGNRGREKGGGN